jgi:hypothetical protein
VNAPWEQCKEHGRAEARVWACPTCLVERLSGFPCGFLPCRVIV